MATTMADEKQLVKDLGNEALGVINAMLYHLVAIDCAESGYDTAFEGVDTRNLIKHLRSAKLAVESYQTSDPVPTYMA